jgi:hypothetical protein
VHLRIAVGVGAWLLGVGAATGGSLLAVSLLGQGIVTNNTQQLTAAAVIRALASESTEAAQPGGAGPSLPTVTPSPSRSPASRPPTTTPPLADVSPSAAASSARPDPSRSAHATGSASARPTPSPSATQTATAVLNSQGGAVVAECLPAGAYLLSWSPTQGYEAGSVIRGPGVTAQVTFESTANAVTMVVSCSTGVPTATTTVSGGDDGGGGHDE